MFVEHLCPLPWIYLRREWTETTNYWNLSKFKAINSVQKCLIVPEIILDLDIIRIKLQSKFHFNIYILSNKNERKLQIIGIFLGPRGINSVEKCYIVPLFELVLDIIIFYLYTKFHYNTCILCKEKERKLVFVRPGAQLCWKLLICTQNQTWPIYDHDKPAYKISFQYVHPL